VLIAYAASDAKILWRMKTPVIFMFAVPALLTVLLGPAVSGAASDFPGRSVIGFAVLFSFMTINYVGLALFREFVGNTWLRQATHRPPRAAFVLGKICPVAGAGLLQLVVFGSVAFAVYRLPLHGDVLQLVVVAAALVLCGSFAGVVLHNVANATSTFQSVTYLLLLGMGGVGGTIVSPDHLPALSRLLSPFTPHYWAMAAFTETTVGSGSWGPTLRALAVIGGTAAVLAAIAFTTFDYRAEKSVLA
jgi:ABC-2 type transport system permease protein